MKKIVIIGGGVGGLTAGVYAQKAGFQSVIIEKLPTVGGLCTCWNRKGMEVDGCIHWIVGSKEGELNNMWNDVHAFKNEDILIPETNGIYSHNGKSLTIYPDPKKFEEELLKVAPEDKKAIKRLMKDLKLMYNMPMPIDDAVNILPLHSLMKIGFKELPYLLRYFKLRKTSSEKYAKNFKSDLISYLINNLPPTNGNSYAMIYTLSNVVYGNAGIPQGGSLKFVNNIRDYYYSLGGEIKTNRSVTELLVNDKEICYGVKLNNGEEIKGDYIVSTIDAHELYSKILSKNYFDMSLLKLYKKPEKYDSPSGFMITFKVDSELFTKKMGSYINYFDLNKPIKVGNTGIKSLILRNYSYDSYFIRNGKVTLTTLIDQHSIDYPFWEEIYKDKEAYKAEKERIAEEVKDAIASHYDVSRDELEIIDAFSPATLNRYTGAYKGSYMCFELHHKNHMKMHNGKFKGLKNFYFAGQWAQMPGGLPPTLIVSKFTIQRIMKKEKHSFSHIHNLFMKTFRKPN